MRTQFETWLSTYKEFKEQKIKNTISLIDKLSDEALNQGVIDKSLYESNEFMQFAVSRQRIIKSKSLSELEKRALSLLGDYYQIIECAPISFINRKHSVFYEYCDKIRVTYSYKMVLLIILIELEAWKIPVSLDVVMDRFCNYYNARIKDGLIAEKDDSVFSSDSLDKRTARKVIMNNPIAVLCKDSVVFTDDGNSIIGISSRCTPNDDDESSEIRQMLLRKLEGYYSCLASQKKQLSFYSDINNEIELLSKKIEKSGNREKIIASNTILEKLKSIWICDSKNKDNPEAFDAS